MSSIIIILIVCTFGATLQITESSPALKSKPVLTRLTAFDLDHITPSQILIDSIPKEDRGLFVKYHLQKALQNHNEIQPKALALTAGVIPSYKLYEFMDIEAPQTFGSDLLNWMKNQFNATASELYEMVSMNAPICQKGVCFDPNDVGEMCCPF